jgi:hypothetical protein
MCLLVCRRTVWWRSKDSPVARPVYGPSVRDGSSAPGRAKTKERGSPVCSTRDQVHLSDELGCRTAGCERGFYAKAVATRLQKARNRSAADTVRIDAGGTGIRPHRVCRQRGCAWGVATAMAVKLLSTQIVRKQAKAIFHLQQRCTLHATSSSTLSNSTNGWLTWQRRS